MERGKKEKKIIQCKEGYGVRQERVRGVWDVRKEREVEVRRGR